MTEEDQADYERFMKLLDRLGKAVVMSTESETSEIIRRRLFERDEKALTCDGRIILSRDAIETCSANAALVNDQRDQIPQWFAIDNAKDEFTHTYPFHPVVLSVFESKMASAT